MTVLIKFIDRCNFYPIFEKLQYISISTWNTDGVYFIYFANEQVILLMWKIKFMMVNYYERIFEQGEFSFMKNDFYSNLNWNWIDVIEAQL